MSTHWLNSIPTLLLAILAAASTAIAGETGLASRCNPGEQETDTLASPSASKAVELHHRLLRGLVEQDWEMALTVRRVARRRRVPAGVPVEHLHGVTAYDSTKRTYDSDTSFQETVIYRGPCLRIERFELQQKAFGSVSLESVYAYDGKSLRTLTTGFGSDGARVFPRYEEVESPSTGTAAEPESAQAPVGRFRREVFEDLYLMVIPLDDGAPVAAPKCHPSDADPELVLVDYSLPESVCYQLSLERKSGRIIESHSYAAGVVSSRRTYTYGTETSPYPTTVRIEHFRGDPEPKLIYEYEISSWQPLSEELRNKSTEELFTIPRPAGEHRYRRVTRENLEEMKSKQEQ